MMWKYDNTHTSHINNIYQLISRTDFRQKIHKVDKRSKKMRREYFFLELKGFDIGYRGFIEEDIMVGGRYRRELEDEAQKWKRHSKVWNILKKGKITNFIE